MVRAFLGSIVIGAPLVAVAMGLAATGPGARDAVSYFLILLVAVLGMGIFSGNSGILSYGHVAFVGLGAYAAGLLTLDAATKSTALPRLPEWLADVALGFPAALAVAIVVAGVFAFVIGIPIARLPPYSGSLATFGLFISVNAVLLGATSFTRGAQTFYGLQPLADLRIFLISALAAIFVARWFRESVWGLQLRASREDALAADALGVDVWRVRLAAWTLSGAVTAAAGVLLGHWLTSFAPKDFSLNLTFTLVAMLIVGGSTTTLGQVAGTALIALLTYFLRSIENGVVLGPVAVPPFYGLSQLVIGLAILVIMIRRREGLFGRLELDERIVRRRPAPARPAA